MKSDKTPDEVIVKRILNGDTDSFTIIVDRYQKIVFSIGMRFFKNEDDSYDFAQEVFIKAYRKMDSFKERSPFRFWLTRIAYNHGINKIKAGKEEIKLPEEALEGEEKNPEMLHSESEVKEVLLNAIDQLSENYKICVDLYFFLGLSYKQISTITGYPVNTIKSNVFRAKQALRDSLKGTIAEEYYEV
ncbi:MAG: sigma-70 family RNA polymerase sigma factor [bacterium]|nr:sigma-70 family RNA polymerase sigma factor [bacterium]